VTGDCQASTLYKAPTPTSKIFLVDFKLSKSLQPNYNAQRLKLPLHLRLPETTHSKASFNPIVSHHSNQFLSGRAPTTQPAPTGTPTTSKMSLVNLSHVCSHLSNASKARLGLTSVPLSNLHLSLLLSLQSSGFLSSVTRGGLTPPPLDSLSSYIPEPVTQTNISTRRLWLGLKYWNNEPVLSKMEMVSKPTRRIWMDVEGLGKVVRGREANGVKGLTRPGESMFVSTDRGVMEARECVERRVGGMLLCRVL
jgi:ribosomal protein S8